jgi:hypothetical protein
VFKWLFGKKKEDAAHSEGSSASDAAAEAFDKAKQEALERVLGPMDDTVYHSIIPFFLGGGLDLYPFSKCIPGVVLVTQELVTHEKSNRPKPGRDGYFELVACTPPHKRRDDSEVMKLVNSMLNPTARYASMASLNPNETAEIPQSKGPNLPIVFDSFSPRSEKFVVGEERLHLLLCIAIQPSELAHARKHGTKDLLERLKKAKVHPYSYLDREPVA